VQARAHSALSHEPVEPHQRKKKRKKNLIVNRRPPQAASPSLQEMAAARVRAAHQPAASSSEPPPARLAGRRSFEPLGYGEGEHEHGDHHGPQAFLRVDSHTKTITSHRSHVSDPLHFDCPSCPSLLPSSQGRPRKKSLFAPKTKQRPTSSGDARTKRAKSVFTKRGGKRPSVFSGAGAQAVCKRSSRF
jgi:hypothetical protein